MNRKFFCKKCGAISFIPIHLITLKNYCLICLSNGKRYQMHMVKEITGGIKMEKEETEKVESTEETSEEETSEEA